MMEVSNIPMPITQTQQEYGIVQELQQEINHDISSQEQEQDQPKAVEDDHQEQQFQHMHQNTINVNTASTLPPEVHG